MRRKLVFLFFLCLLAAGGYWLYRNYYKLFQPGRSDIYTPAKYVKLKEALRLGREKLARDGGNVVEKAGLSFTTFVKDSIFPFWYGTDWDFHGTTEIPGNGSIACGYFVTTVLRDAGVKLDRSRLAQCASEEMIKALVPAKSIKRFSNVSIGEFEKAVKKWGDGIYLVGLDNHTGFIVCSGGNVEFVHSGGGYPPHVLVQKPAEAALLAKSKYRVLAKLTGSETFLQKWIKGEKFK